MATISAMMRTGNHAPVTGRSLIIKSLVVAAGLWLFQILGLVPAWSATAPPYPAFGVEAAPTYTPNASSPEMTISWKESTYGEAATSFIVEVSDDGGQSWFRREEVPRTNRWDYLWIGQDRQSHTVRDLHDGVSYQFRVISANDVGQSSPSGESTSVVTALPAEAKGPHASSVVTQPLRDLGSTTRLEVEAEYPSSTLFFDTPTASDCSVDQSGFVTRLGAGLCRIRVIEVLESGSTLPPFNIDVPSVPVDFSMRSSESALGYSLDRIGTNSAAFAFRRPDGTTLSLFAPMLNFTFPNDKSFGSSLLVSTITDGSGAVIAENRRWMPPNFNILGAQEMPEGDILLYGGDTNPSSSLSAEQLPPLAPESCTPDTSNVGQGGFVARLDASGNVAWYQRLKDCQFTFATGALVDTDGSLLVTGMGGANGEPRVARINADSGEVILARSLSEQRVGSPLITSLPDGDFAVAAPTDGVEALPAWPGQAGRDIVVWRIGSDMATRSVAQFGTSGQDGLVALAAFAGAPQVLMRLDGPLPGNESSANYAWVRLGGSTPDVVRALHTTTQIWGASPLDPGGVIAWGQDGTSPMITRFDLASGSVDWSRRLGSGAEYWQDGGAQFVISSQGELAVSVFGTSLPLPLSAAHGTIMDYTYWLSATGPPVIPSSPDLTADPGDSSLQLHWTAPSDASTQLIVQYRPEGAQSWNDLPDQASDGSYTIEGLLNGTGYSVRAKHVLDGMSSEWQVIQGLVPRTTPGPPTEVSATRGNASATLDFNPPSSDGGAAITALRIEKSVDGGQSWQLAKQVQQSSGPVNVEDLVNGTAYIFRIAAINAAGTGVWSEPSNGVVPATVPDPPTSVSALRSDRAAVISWQAPVSDGGLPVESYEAVSDPGAFSCSATTEMTCTVSGLTNGVNYRFSVIARNSVGTSLASEMSPSVTPATTPGGPRNVTADAGFRHARVRWDAPLTDGGDPITGYTATATPGGSSCTSDGARSCNILGLLDFQAYRFSVTAHNSVGSGPASELGSPIQLEGDAASARISSSSARGLTNAPLVFSADGSTSLSGNITRVEWDLDGRGFEPGEWALSTSWSTPGSKTVRLRVTGEGGASDTATASVDIYRKSAMEPGISIDGGRAYTTNKNVVLGLGWPDWAVQARISNDGGFQAYQTVDVADEIPWVLDDTVTGGFTKVVYVRFSGPGVDQTRAYSDDIILDNRPPEIKRASAVRSEPSTKGISRSVAQGAQVRAKVKYTVRVKAFDRLTGVSNERINTKRRANGATTLKFRPKTTALLFRSSTLFIQVQDGAGNWTRWKKISVSR